MKNGWQTKTLGDVCEVIAGQSPEGKFYNSEGNGHPFYQGKKDFGEKFIEAPTTWTTQTTKVAKEGDILMSVRAPVGPVNFSTEEICIGRGLAAIRSGIQLNRDFLFYQLLHLQPEIAGKEGAVFASINKAEIEALPLAFAPLAEQRRIVGLLDEAFAGLATAKANAEKNLQNARALFESHLQSVFTQRGPGWRHDQLDALTEPDTPITYGVVKPGDEGEITFVRGGDLVRGKVRLTQLRTITRAVSDQYRRTLLRGGELLICLVGQPGQVAVAPIELAGANIARQVGLIRLKKIIDAEFVRYFLQSAPGAEALGARESGSVQQVINLGELRQVSVHYPEFAQQRKIVAGLEAMETETQRLARLYERKQAALVALKKSLLHQAFTGEL